MAKYDTYFQPVPADKVHGFKVFEYGFKASVKVTGPQSLVSRWAKTIMTPRGTDPISRNYGTGFSELIGSNISSVTTDLVDAITIAIEETNEQVREQDLIGLFPENERLASATLLNIEQSTDGVDVWVNIQNVAGESVPFRIATI
jgi:hypothetical protein